MASILRNCEGWGPTEVAYIKRSIIHLMQTKISIEKFCKGIKRNNKQYCCTKHFRSKCTCYPIIAHKGAGAYIRIFKNLVIFKAPIAFWLENGLI